MRISVDGADVLDRSFNRIVRKIEDQTDVMEAAGKEFFEIEEDQFRSGGHGKWPELSPKYEESKGRTHNFMPLMRREDKLYPALTRKGADHQVYEVTKDSLTVGTDLAYARAHMKPYKKRPARPPIDLREEDKKRLIKAMQRPLVAYARAQAGFVQTGMDDLG